MVERERLEDSGIGDELMEMQQVLWPVEWLRAHVFVKIEWNDTYVRDGDSKVTKNQLKKTKWKPNATVGGTWQEDLYH